MRVLLPGLLVCTATAYPSSQTELSHHKNVFSKISSYLVNTIYGIPNEDSAIRPLVPLSRTRRTTKYGNDVVLRFNISSGEEAKALSNAANTLFLDIWEFNKDWADIRISKEVIESLLGFLPKSIRYDTLIYDLPQAIDDSRGGATGADDRPGRATRSTQPEFGASIKKRPDEANIFFNDYQPLSVIVPWMRLMQSLFPTHVRIIDIGTSFEGRSILGLKVGVRPKNNDEPTKKRKTVLITGGSHAREWISVSSATYAAYALITSYGKVKRITKLIEDFDWVFIPTINPDGYVKTWEKDRLWRKNTQETAVPFCQGYDIDRAFAYEWNGESTRGNPCSESFAGDLPFQAIEALRLANWVKNEVVHGNVTFVGYLDLHSYSQQILYPYAFSCIQTPPSLEDLEEVGLGLAKAIHSNSREFYGVTSACEGSVSTRSTEGLSFEEAARRNWVAKRSRKKRSNWPMIETNGGTALDWMYHDIGTKYAFQLKLPDTGSHGFLLPRKFIVPTGEDVFAAVSYLGGYLMSNKGAENINAPLKEPGLQRPLDNQTDQPRSEDTIMRRPQAKEINGEVVQTDRNSLDLR